MRQADRSINEPRGSTSGGCGLVPVAAGGRGVGVGAGGEAGARAYCRDPEGADGRAGDGATENADRVDGEIMPRIMHAIG